MNYRRFTKGLRLEVLISSDVTRFLASAPRSEGIYSTLRLLADQGQVRNTQRFRKERGQIFAVKNGAVRVYGWFTANQMFVAGHGVLKKKQKADPVALDVAERLAEEFSRGEYEIEAEEDGSR